MRYVLTAQDFQFVSSPNGQTARALAMSVPASVWESLDKLSASFETEVKEEISNYQAMLLESFETIQEIGKTQKALFYAAVDDLKIKTKEEYNQAVQESLAIYEGVWDTAKSVLSALTEGGSPIGILHLVLDLIGLVPASWVGFPIDVLANVLNGIIYAVRGMWFLAILSLIAAVPANYLFKGLKMSFTPFAKVADKLGIAIFKGDKAAVKLASSELKTAAGIEKAAGLGKALDTFVQFAKTTLIKIIKGIGWTLDKILGTVLPFGIYPKGKIVKFIEEFVEVPLMKAVKGSEEAVLALKEGDEVLAKTTKAEIDASTTIKAADKEAMTAKFNKLAHGDGDLVGQVMKSDGYTQLVKKGAPKAAIEAYTNAAIARMAFSKTFTKAETILADPSALKIIRAAGGVPEKELLVKAINKGDTELISKLFNGIASDPLAVKGMTETEAALIKVYGKYPEQFIKHGKNFDNYLVTITKIAGKFAYREKIARKLLLFMIRQIAKAVMSWECYTYYMNKISGISSTEDLERVATEEMVKESESFDKNSKKWKEVRDLIIKENGLEDTPESAPEIDALTEEALKTAQRTNSNCKSEEEMTNALIGGEISNPGLMDDNLYGQKPIGDKEFKKIEDVLVNQAELTGLPTNIKPTKNLQNADPMIQLYYSDVYNGKTDKLIINTQEESNIYEVRDRLIKEGKLKASDANMKVKEIQEHWNEGTEPNEVKRLLDSTDVNESLQINNQVSLLRFENFKNSINTK